MVSLTFYGGAGEIGGNKILLEDKGAKIYLDFGQSFDFGEEYFYEWLQPRSANGLEVYFEFGMVPRVPKLYSSDALKVTNLKYRKPDVDAVFISHSHSDHTGHLNFLDESIPVYMGHGTHKLLEAYSKLYPSLLKLGEHDFRLFQSSTAAEGLGTVFSIICPTMSASRKSTEYFGHIWPNATPSRISSVNCGA